MLRCLTLTVASHLTILCLWFITDTTISRYHWSSYHDCITNGQHAQMWEIR